jgi:hypothetical protein
MHVREIAQQHTVAAVETLVEIMRDEEAPPAARATAAVAILDRAWGRPTQMIVSAHLGARGARDFTEAELLAIIDQAQQPALPAPTVDGCERPAVGRRGDGDE